MIFRLPDNERAVIYTLGRISGVKGPGMVFVMPWVQIMKRVDVSPGKVETPAATVTYHVTDAAKALEQVADFRDAMAKLVATTVQNVVASRAKDALVFERRGMEEESLKKLNAIAIPWGLQVEKVEIKR